MAGYGDDPGFAAWLTMKGRTLPGSAPAPAVLRERGSSYVDALYYDRFPGVPTGGAEQERQWPRTDAVDRWGEALASDTVPQRVIEASYEAAWIEGTNAGSLSSTYTPGAQKILSEVKNIKWTVVGGKGDDTRMVLVSSDVEGLLGPLLIRGDLPVVKVL